MNNERSEHFSYSYELNLNKLPSHCTDRVKLHSLLPGIFLGTVFAGIGIFDMLGGFISSKTVFDSLQKSVNQTPSLLSPTVFDTVLAIIGLGMVVFLFSTYVKYKKIFFDGDNFTITHRSFLGKKTVSEKLKNYEGINIRVEPVQHSLFSKNRYIIELQNKDYEKTVPLYIKINNIDVKKKAEYFASVLGKDIINN